MSRSKRAYNERTPGKHVFQEGDQEGTVFEALAFGQGEAYEPSNESFEPTDAIPGSIAKVDVMRSRLDRGLPVHHPNDRRYYGDDQDDDGA